MRLEFEVNKTDLAAYYRWCSSSHPHFRNGWVKFERKRMAATVATVVATLVYAGLVFTSVAGTIEPGNVLVLSLGGGIAYLWWWSVGAWKLKRERWIDDWIAKSAQESIDGEGTITLDVTLDAISWSRSGTTITDTWRNACDLMQGDAFVGVRRCDGGMYFVPMRVLHQQGLHDEFVQLCNSALKAHGSDRQSRFSRYFASGDHQCPRCSQSLRGTLGVVCPECGHEMSYDDFPKATSQVAITSPPPSLPSLPSS